MKRAVERDIEDLAPLGVAHFGERLYPPQRSIVYQDIGYSEAYMGFLRNKEAVAEIRALGNEIKRLTDGKK